MNDEQLELLAQGSVSDHDSVTWQVHVDSCDSCRKSLEERIANEEALGKLRGVSSDSFVSASGRKSIEDSIAGYVIVDEIRRGGQGVVYRAEQTSTGRSVAIKVMKDGPFSSAGDRLRFEREVHLLGQLRHPNIVTIHDSGQAGGNDFFVMDFIDGVSLDERIRHWPKAQLNETLRLFAGICEAVNAAHLRGIIHRDLKPSNILIDSENSPHVLDFGLAKMSGDSEASTRTITGQFVGSLPWASPEQVEGMAGEIDVRTDVYSLGVMLYQLLTGDFPYNVVAGPREVFDNILTVEPDRPSLQCRRKKAPLRIDDDLDTIAIKCLAKDRNDRYQTAGEIARDIERFLDGEPIAAKRDSFGYVLRKQLRKHKLRAATAVMFVLVIIVGFVTSFSLWRQAENARADAVQSGIAEAEQRKLAEENEAAAIDEAEKANAINDFLRAMIAAVQPRKAAGNRDITIREALDAAAQQLDEGSLKDQPSVEAAVRATLGETYADLGLFDQAQPNLERAVELARSVDAEPNLATAEYIDDLATLYQRKGEYKRAVELFRECRSIVEAIPDVPLDTKASVLNNLAAALLQTRELPEAKSLFEKAIAHLREMYGDEHEALPTALGNVAQLEFYMGNPARALELLEESLAIRRSLFEGDHPDIAQSLNNLAFVLHRTGELDEAESMFREALAMDERMYGEKHPSVAIALNNLGLVLQDKGDIDEANKTHRHALAMRRELLQHGSRELLSSIVHVADAAQEMDQLEEAEDLYDEALTYPFEAFPRGEYDYVSLQATRGSVLVKLGRLDEATEVLTQCKAYFERDDVPTTEADMTRINKRLEVLEKAKSRNEADIDQPFAD